MKQLHEQMRGSSAAGARTDASDFLAAALFSTPTQRAAEGRRAVAAMRRVIAALLPPAVVVVSVGSMVATLGIVSGLSSAVRLLWGTRRSVKPAPEAR